MKAFKKGLLRIIMACLLLVNMIVPALPAAPAFAAIDASNKSVENPPQAIVGKTDVATWNYTSSTQVTDAAPNFAATSGYYSNPSFNSTLQLFKSNAQVTSGLSYGSGGITNTNFSGQMDKGYWYIKTSTAGFKDLVFNYSARSSGTGPRDLNTEWSTDGTNWSVFGNKVADTGYTVKIESTSLEQFGMILPAEAANQNTLYIRIIQKSEASEGNGTIGTSGTYTVNGIQLYGTKDPAFTTPPVTASPNTTGAILDVTPITLSNTDSNAHIFYTTDGTTPATTAGGSTKLYTAPITALSAGGFTGTDPFVVKAVAKLPTLLPSDVATLSFTQQTITSNTDAKKLDAGKYVWVKGIGTYSTATNTLYIQDGMNAGSGLCIFKSGADISSYVGKEIYVYGKATVYNGLMEIVPDDVTTNIVVRNASPTLPTPTKIMFSQLADRTYEGMLVSFDTVKLNTVAGTNTGSLYNHTVSQAGIQTTLRSNGIASAVGVTGSYVNITRSIANYFNGVQLLSSNAADLVAATTPTVEFMTSSVPTGTAIPLNSKVTLATATTGAKITYSLNGGTPVISTTNSVDITVDALQNGKATITATASDGTYTTATQTFTYTQSQVAKVSASPGSSAINPATPIALSSATTDSTIIYSVYRNSFSSTDGTLVGTANQIYTAPITLDASYFPVRIAAKATLQNYVDSDPENFAYTAKKAIGGEKNYYGSLHAHTINSDGQGTLEEAYKYARDQGKFDFFIVTDHSNSYDSATYDVTKDQNINNYNKTNAPWLAGKKAALEAATSTYVTDYGYEMTWSGGPGHMNTFNTTGFVSRNNATLNNKTNDAGLQTYYQMLKGTPGSISQLNHPGATFGNFANFGYYDNAIDDKVTLVEAGNGEGAVGSGGYFRSVDQFILALDKGWHVAPTNNGDNHKKGWGTSNTAATVVYTNDFTLSGIYAALHDRSVWSTENRDLDVTYHLTDGTNTYSMGAILNAPPATANITVTATNKNPGTATSNIASVQLLSYGGKIVDQKTYPSGTSNVNYTYSMTAPSAGYYFAIVTDNQGFVAVTAPIWLGSSPKIGITSVTNSTVMPVTTEALNLTTNFFNNESTPVTLKSISYTVDGDSAANKTYTPGTTITSSGVAAHVFSYTPSTTGTKTVTISAVITVNGEDKTYTTTSTMKVVDINSVSYVGLDASHGNEYVSGGSYPDSMANMMALAGANSVRVVQLKTSAELIDATSNPKYKMIILNAPSRKSVPAWPTPVNYSAAEIAALKAFSENGNTLVFGNIADYAESANADPASPKKHMAELQNDVLEAIGSTLREGDDEVLDDDKNGGQPYRLYPTEFNMANPLLKGVVDGQTYSQYSGSTIYAVDPATGERTSTLPTTVSPLVFGFPTAYSSENDNDNFGYGTTMPTFPYVTVGTYKTDKGISNSQGLYIPKYVNPNSKVATNPEEKLLAASETVTHPNGKTSLVVVAGGAFMSNFEIQVTLDNAGTLPYANYNLMDNLYKTVNPLTITSIANAKNLPDGTDVIIEATATTEVNTQSANPDTNKGFFDSIYAQDATGGINLFPVASGILEGQKARFEGKITHYQGEVELTVSKMTVVDPSIHKFAPTTLTTAASMSPVNTGLLVKTEGVVSDVYKDNDGTINQFTINDGSGPAIVFINGYITKGTTLPFVTDGASVSVVGLASVGEVSSDSDMHPRLRVRDRSEILNVSSTVDKSALKTEITNAQTLLGSRTVGTANGNVSQAGHDALKNAITAAIAVQSDANASQAEVDAQVRALATATLTFNDSIVSEVPLTINGLSTMNVGESSVAEATYGTTKLDATSGVIFTSSITAVAEINSTSGQITAISKGQTVITATYGVLSKAYILTVNAVASTNANLASLKLDNSTISLTSNQTEYSTSVGNSVISATVSAAAEDANAVVEINGEAVSSKLVNLSKGLNTIKIIVTAQDGTTKKEYKLQITRADDQTSNSSGSSSAPSGTLISSSNGGTVKDNGVTIVIPAGAAKTDFRVTVEKVTNTDELLKNASGKLIGDVFEIKKDFADNFTANLTLSLPFDPAKVDLAKFDPAVYWYDETAKKWNALSNPSVDKDKAMVSGKVNHFTKFAVFATEKKPTEPTNTGSTGKGTLSDIAGHWAEANIRELIQSGAIEGYPNGTFGPDRTITRAEFASILVKAFKLQEKSGKGFADTNNHWARKAIETAAAYGIISGYSDSSFGPDDQITREQMAAMIVRAAKLPAAAAGHTFTDRTAISDWAQSAVASASASHVIDGYSDGSFKPQANATRAEAVTVIMKSIKK